MAELIQKHLSDREAAELAIRSDNPEVVRLRGIISKMRPPEKKSFAGSIEQRLAEKEAQEEYQANRKELFKKLKRALGYAA